jgi:hypothetical protein
MTEQEFRSRMAQAETMCGLSDRPAYYEGYMRGSSSVLLWTALRYPPGHEGWLDLFYGWDKTRADGGRGYQDGLQGIRPVCYYSATDTGGAPWKKASLPYYPH